MTDRNRMMKFTAIVAVLTGLSAACRVASREAVAVDSRAIEDTLRSLVTRSFEDISKRNAEGALMPMADDVVFVGDGMMVTGKDSLLRMTALAFSDWHSVKADVEITRVQVLSPEAAVVNWESHVTAIDSKGVETPLGGIVTAVFMKRNGQWRIIQQQQCAPMPLEVPHSMKPSSKAIPES